MILPEMWPLETVAHFLCRHPGATASPRDTWVRNVLGVLAAAAAVVSCGGSSDHSTTVGQDLAANQSPDTSASDVSADAAEPTDLGSGILDTLESDTLESDTLESDTLESDTHVPSVPGAGCGEMKGLEPGSPWPMRGRCPGRTSRSPSAVVPAKPNVSWRYQQELPVASTPAIGADGTVYVGAGTNLQGGALIALTSDGKEKWVRTTGAAIYSPALAADGAICVGSDDGTVSAINPDGTLRWSFTVGGYVDGAPAIGDNGVVYATAWWADVGATTLVAVTPEGTEAWRALPDGAVYTSAATLHPTGLVLVATSTAGDGSAEANSSLRAFHADGTPAWTTLVAGGLGSAPAVGPDGTIYVATDEHLAAVGPNGTAVWTTPDDALSLLPYAPPFVPDLAVSTDGTVYAGPSLRAVRADGQIGAGVAPAGGLVEVFGAAIDAAGNLYFAESRELSAPLKGVGGDGAELWSVSIGRAAAPPSIGADGTLYIGTLAGDVYAVGPSVCTPNCPSPKPECGDGPPDGCGGSCPSGGDCHGGYGECNDGACATCPGAPGCACQVGTDCASGLCYPLGGTLRCTILCIDSCPPASSCKAVSVAGEEVMYICVEP